MAVDILQAAALVMFVAFAMSCRVLYQISFFHGFCSGIVKAAYFCLHHFCMSAFFRTRCHSTAVFFSLQLYLVYTCTVLLYFYFAHTLVFSDCSSR